MRTDCECDAGSNGEWCGRESESRLIVLAEQVFDAGVNLCVRSHRIARAQVKLLIAGREIAIRQKQSIAEERVQEKRAVVAAAYEIPAERGVKSPAVVHQDQAPRVVSSMEWPPSFQRSKSADRNIRE